MIGGQGMSVFIGMCVGWSPVLLDSVVRQSTAGVVKQGFAGLLMGS